MEYFPAPLEKLVEQFARLPGIGGKSAQRLAFFVLGLPEQDAQEFAAAILDAKRNITCCPVCQNFTSGGLCPICSSPKRDEHTICVVADPRDVAAIERSREFNGQYHVLHGVISPMNHVGPDDIAVKPLVERVAKGGVDEVIMATNPWPTGFRWGAIWNSPTMQPSCAPWRGGRKSKLYQYVNKMISHLFGDVNV